MNLPGEVLEWVYRNQIKYLIKIKFNSLRDWLYLREKPIKKLYIEFDRN